MGGPSRALDVLSSVGKKESPPPPWHHGTPSSLGLSPDPEVTEQKRLWCITISLGKQGKKGIHHRSGKKGVLYRGPDPEKGKKGVSTVVRSLGRFS